uniref:Transmembrane protein 128 n=1 Tax=Ciona savignyi TaxID=51511 RepID=H2YD81_CIOSA
MNTLDNPTATMSPVKPKPKRKLDNVLWVILAVFTLYYSDFVTVLLYYPDIRGVFFNLASILGSTALLICAHCVLWSGYFKGVALDTWEKLYPLGVPIATATTLASGVW